MNLEQNVIKKSSKLTNRYHLFHAFANWPLYGTAFLSLQRIYVNRDVMEFGDLVMEKSWNLIMEISWQQCQLCSFENIFFQLIEDNVHKSGRYINSDKKMFTTHTQERMKNLVGKSWN